jgi:hypothetical protein
VGVIHRFLFSLLVVLLPTQLGYHFWPEWSHVLGRRIDYLSPTVFLTDILLFLLIGVWVFESYRRQQSKISIVRKIQKTYTPYVPYALGIIFYVGINVLTSLSPILSLYKWIKVLEYSLLAIYIIKTKPSKSHVVTLLSVALFYSALIAIIQFYLQRSIGGPLWFIGERTFSASTPGIAQFPIFLEIGSWKLDLGLMLRSYGTFPHPNVLGGFIAITIPLLIGALKDTHLSRRSKQFFCINIAVSAVALLLTFSRGAWIVGTIGSIISLLHSPVNEPRIKRNPHWKYGGAIVSSILLFGLFAVVRSGGESVVVRMALNESAISMWERYPLFGVGLGNFITALPSFLPAYFIYFLQPVHNIYLLLLSELGVVGIVLLCVGSYRLMPLIRSVSPHSALTIFRYALLAMGILGLVDHYPLTVQQGQLLLTVLLALNVP